MVTLAIIVLAVAVFVAFATWRKARLARPEEPAPQPVPYKDAQGAATEAPQSFLEEAAPAYWNPARDIVPGDEVLVPVKPRRPNGTMKSVIFVRTFKRHGQPWAKLHPLALPKQKFSRQLTSLARM
ncbi:MAG: hypothetical protein UY91_C0016G0003 [Parcubacteria group bacterium GW2011_GWB1_55_9]|nr:MAG: hypothetical protein UY91_C0016G0003 [Parcubacteria group bacterium GW2011_GWB1_55_9]